jgi:hypothetical protein
MTKAGLRPKPAVFSGCRDCSTPGAVAPARLLLGAERGGLIESAPSATMQKRRRRLPRLPRSFQTGAVLDVEGRRVSFHPGKSRGGDGMSGVLLVPMAVATGVVVIVVAVAIVLVVLFVTVSVRGGQRRGAKRRGETRKD